MMYLLSILVLIAGAGLIYFFFFYSPNSPSLNPAVQDNHAVPSETAETSLEDNIIQTIYDEPKPDKIIELNFLKNSNPTTDHSDSSEDTEEPAYKIINPFHL